MKGSTNRRIEVQVNSLVNEILLQPTKERLTEWPKR
jgi:hypothetical protein